MKKTVSKVLSHIFALILVLGLFSPGVTVEAKKNYPTNGNFTCDIMTYLLITENRYSDGGSRTKNYTAAIMFDIYQLAVYSGRKIEKVVFDYVKNEKYPYTPYTIKIWQGGDTKPETLVYSQKIENEPNDGMNTIVLDTPYTIDSTRNLWLGIETGDNGGAIGVIEQVSSGNTRSQYEFDYAGNPALQHVNTGYSEYRWRNNSNLGRSYCWNIGCFLIHEHDLTYVPKVEPGYKTKSGKKAYYLCDYCGKCFEDAAMTREISDIVTWGVIPPKQDAAEVFKDVRPDHYFYNPVLWAVENEITAGTSDTTFSPYQFCTRAQIVTFLWRYAGKPDGQYEQFIDVKDKQMYYYKAVYWAAEQGITEGIGLHRFAPNSDCTRAEAVSFLYRMMGKPEVSITETKFEDISSEEYYYDAVLWAVENGITAGTSETTFSPYYRCTRAQIVSFIYRMNDAFGK